MHVQITGKDIDLGEALQSHVETRMNDGVHKYFGRPADAHATFSKNGPFLRCDATVHLSSGIILAAQGEGGDAYGAFEDAMEKLEKRVRRYKRRLKDHHANNKTPLPAIDAASYVLAPGAEEEAEPEANGADENPIVIAEATESVFEMTVSDAVMQLDLAEQPAIVFKNAAHGRLNIVYRRPDGNIGWVDPKQTG